MNEETPNESRNPFGNETGLTFADLPLAPAMREAIEAIGYETPSPIQAQAIPHLAEGRDLLGVAQTGTGKTAAFALPLLSRLDLEVHKPQILCLAPTRELAIQVAEAIESFGQRMKGLRVLPVYGGTQYHGQFRDLKRGVHVVVGTPGRIMDHMKRGSLNLESLQALVLDEADEMLSMGFIEDIEWILEQTPETRQTALFSATMPKPIRKLSEQYMRDPAEVTIRLQATTSPNIRQRFLKRRRNEKLETLIGILEVEDFDAMLVFARTKNSSSEIAERLLSRGYAAEALNGDMPQILREKTVGRLREGKLDVLVATDVAARGLDVDRISHVLNYDAPFDVESYIHRTGRTGRAGRAGDAILFVTGKEARILKAIERTVKCKFEPYEFPSVAELNERKTQRLFVRLEETLQLDLSEYREVLDKYLAEKEDADPVALAAALAHLEAGGKPFYLKETPRGTRNERGKRERRNERPGERPTRFETDDIDMETFRLEVGETHGAGKGDIVGALANEAGIESRHMGKIRLFQYFSLIELPSGMPKEIFQSLKNIHVRGRRLEISKDKGRPNHDGGSKSRPYKKFGSKPGGKFHGKPNGKFGPKSSRPRKGPRN